MTTPTLHGAPELPVVAYEVGDMVFPDRYSADSHLVGNDLPDNDLEPLVRLSDARAAIQQAAGAVPEGFRIVPVKPTKQMLIELDKGKFGGSMGTDQNVVKNNYAAMLAASPSPLGREAACGSLSPFCETQSILTRTDEPQPEAGGSDHLVLCAVGGWISVTVRLPEEWAEVDDSPCILEGKPVGTMYTGIEVLVSLSGDGVRLDHLVQIGESGKPWWSKYGERVTHWQPKPAPARRVAS